MYIIYVQSHFISSNVLEFGREGLKISHMILSIFKILSYNLSKLIDTNQGFVSSI